MDAQDASRACRSVLERVGEAVIADEQFLETVLIGVLARGHVLLEDVPGTGKTLTARSFADALGLSFQRVQFTPDLLPADITGSNIYDKSTGQFEFSPGPVFANVVLADEINRAPPKTQAALLEAMGERQVTVDGETHELPEPFFVIATQNPIEQEGTFALPEAQRDRFAVKAELGYPDRAGERELIDRRADRDAKMPSVRSVLEGQSVTDLQDVPETVRVDEKIRDYVVDLGRATREDERVDVGVSPRGVQRLFETARASAVVAGREYVVPDDVKRVAGPTLRHRLVLTAEASVRGVRPADALDDVLDRVAVPAVADD
ncbi:AAA+ ATPase of MoxR-like family, a component of a putative secretion system [Halapricum desulfuricans]|uniref:AAA+ ATPase of MoxR-like family, a component of a putative secretion system n=1 Tax=Halapricum desulfuricans TaxID=2841257 RepID=A0A897NJA0_9EURY|nr:AAA family ATPase [Halapricum desulfuricans]QSG12514.1 AAA+ ATPase of MoxR-like family, a component of a putative secretion system [Halapricum desulfuricans]